MSDLKKMYSTILGDHFPLEMTISFGDQKLIYRKRTWKIAQEDGSIDHGALGTAGVSGLYSYYKNSAIKQLEFARPKHL